MIFLDLIISYNAFFYRLRRFLEALLVFSKVFFVPLIISCGVVVAGAACMYARDAFLTMMMCANHAELASSKHHLVRLPLLIL
jgi:hypothetical protein